MDLDVYRAAHETFVWRDMSHFGRFLVSGADAATLLHHLTTADIKNLPVGQGSDAILLTNKARVLDWLSVFRRNRNEFEVMTSPNRRELFLPHAQKFVLFRQDVKFEPLPGPFYGVFGPDAAKINWLTRRLPGTGLLSENQPKNAPSCDNDTFNVLRIEAGIPVTGLELTEEVNPWEANFDFAISLAKGCYNGQEVIARLNTYQKIKQRLVGLKFEKSPPAGRFELQNAVKNAGWGVSACDSPRFGAIGLAFVRSEFLTPETVVEVAGEAPQTAVVVSLPFVKNAV